MLSRFYSSWQRDDWLGGCRARSSSPLMASSSSISSSSTINHKHKLIIPINIVIIIHIMTKQKYKHCKWLLQNQLFFYFPNDDQGGREQYYRMDESESRPTLADRLQVLILEHCNQWFQHPCKDYDFYHN